MTALSPDAKGQIREAGLTLRGYARSMMWADNEAGRWYGDTCGCSDDRCVGYHHDPTDECGCLPVLIARALAEAGAGSASEALSCTHTVTTSEVGLAMASDETMKVRHVRMSDDEWITAATKANDEGYKISQVVRLLLREYVAGNIELGVKTKG